LFFHFGYLFCVCAVFSGSRDGPERASKAIKDPFFFTEIGLACIQYYGGLEADKIVMGISPHVDTETAFAYSWRTVIPGSNLTLAERLNLEI